MSGFQTPITIRQVLERISEHHMLLPAFQREFVWKDYQITNLFDSIMKDYPFSSMLFWKVKNKDKKNYQYYPFVRSYKELYHTFENRIATESLNDFHSVLDGQQRLTALYIGFRGTYASKIKHRPNVDDENSFPTKKLYLNLSKRNDENKYWFKFLSKNESENHSNIFRENDNVWFRIGYIESIESFSSFIRNNDNQLNEFEMSTVETLKDVLNKPIINFYEIEDKNHEEAVTIFIRINSGGTHLSYSDIMFSMLVSSWNKVEAKVEFDKLIKNISNLGFSISNDYIIRAILFLFHKDVSFNLNSFTNEFLASVEDKWIGLHNAISELFLLLRDYGFQSSTLTSISSTLPILYYIYHRSIYKDFSSKVSFKEDRSEMKRWLQIMLVKQIFGASVDNVLKQARDAFTDDINLPIKESRMNSFPSAIIRQAIKKASDISEETIDELLYTQFSHVKSFALLSLLYPNLDYRNGNFHKDHMHPYSVCKEKGLANDVINSIVNLQLLDANENKSKNDKNLEDWIKDKNMSDTEKVSFFKQQHIPNINLSIDNFENFIIERKKILKKYLIDIFN